ncbi:MAG: glycosyltransferase N-terminal domain-containing protein [Leptospirales bacterium]
MLIWKLIYNIIVLPVFLILLIPGQLIFPKIRRTVREHRGLWERTTEALKKRKKKKLIWIHAASAGEYLQGKPLIEEFSRIGYDCFLTLTSVSGYRWVRAEKNSSLLHFEYYPFDLPFSATRFIDIVKPDAIVFIKTDLWPNLVWKARKKEIPLYLVSASLSRYSGKYNSKYVRSYYCSLVNSMKEIMTVEKEDAELFQEIVQKKVTVSVMGDSRYESVVKRKKESPKYKLPLVTKNTIIFGSLRRAEFNIVLPVLFEILKNKPNIQAIIAPHEIDDDTLNKLEQYLSEYKLTRFSTLQKKTGTQIKTDKSCRIIVIDTIGHLFSLYQNAFLAYVGGGFSSGVHNTLEPGVMGLPIIIGPKYWKFREAVGMVKEGIIYAAESPLDLPDIFNSLLSNSTKREMSGKKALKYISERSGVSKKIVKKIAGSEN